MHVVEAKLGYIPTCASNAPGSQSGIQVAVQRLQVIIIRPPSPNPDSSVRPGADSCCASPNVHRLKMDFPVSTWGGAATWTQQRFFHYMSVSSSIKHEAPPKVLIIESESLVGNDDRSPRPVLCSGNNHYNETARCGEHRSPLGICIVHSTTGIDSLRPSHSPYLTKRAKFKGDNDRRLASMLIRRRSPNAEHPVLLSASR